MFRYACLLVCLILASGSCEVLAAEAETCHVGADHRVEEPVRAIIAEYVRRTGVRVDLDFRGAAALNARGDAGWKVVDVAIVMADTVEGDIPLSRVDNAKKVAWKHPGGEPVWAAVVEEHARAGELVEFLGGPVGHQLWSSSKAGFTIVSGESHAEAFDWVVENRLKHTYPMTAMRILGELGGIRKGICIDIGCGTGNLDVELAKRSEFKIVGLDIDGDMQPLFEKRMKEAGLDKRITCKVGALDAIPFEDGSIDLIAGVGPVLIWGDRQKKLAEIYRVLRPGGVALVGGRFLGMPESRRVSTETLRADAEATGIAGIRIVEDQGQWVEVVKGVGR